MKTIFRKTCDPIMPYYGGKGLQAEWVNQHLPCSATAYVEGFAGSLAVGLARRPAACEVFNDFDPGVANLYRVVREQPEQLRNALRFTLQSRAEHDCCRRTETDRPAGLESNNTVEWARRHLVLIRQSYAAMFAGSWGYVRQSSAGSFHRVVDLIPPAAARLRNAVIENLHFRDLIAKYRHLGRDCLWYLDPPYVPETRIAEKVYRCEMKLPEHQLLMNLITGLDGMVVLSGYRSKLYDVALSGWMRVERTVHCYSSPTTRASGLTAKPMRTECLWINPAAADCLRREGRWTCRAA